MPLQIEVTNIETGSVERFDVSRVNWRNVPACMRDGLVHMWVPPELHVETVAGRAGRTVITSGRRWKLLEPETGDG